MCHSSNVGVKSAKPVGEEHTKVPLVSSITGSQVFWIEIEQTCGAQMHTHVDCSFWCVCELFWSAVCEGIPQFPLHVDNGMMSLFVDYVAESLFC